MRTLIDGYPLADDDPDREIQLGIERYLAGPANEKIVCTSVLSTIEHEHEYACLFPILRRAEWLIAHPERALPRWAPLLVSGVGLILNHNREQSEEELLALLGYSAVFRITDGLLPLDELTPRVVTAFRKSKNRERWLAAIENACFEFEQFVTIYGGRNAAALGMALMLAPDAPAATSPCWSTAVANDLRSMKKANAAAWRPLLKLADTWLIHPLEPEPGKVAAAVDRIGAAEFAARCRAWTAPLEGRREVRISWRGVAVLKILLHGAAASKAPELQPSITAIANAIWQPADRFALALESLVGAIAKQPEDFARPCLEQLALKPYTADNAALRSALSSFQPESPLGVDGFPLDSRPETAAFQRRLDGWLRAGGDKWPLPLEAYGSARTALCGESQESTLLEALLDRVDWIHEHRALLPPADAYKERLRRWMAECLKAPAAIESAHLLRLIELRVNKVFAGFCAEGFLPALERHVATHGWDRELVAVIERWHKASHGTAADQNARRRLGSLLWQEDVKPVNPKSCWSARIRQDLRDMPAKKAEHWRRLLAATTFHLAGEPSAKWKKQTAPLLAAVGAEEFASRLHQWFRPFGEGKPLRLEPAGRDVLRILLWHTADIQDQRIDEALVWCSNARWSTKKSASYANLVIGPLVYAAERRSLEVAFACLDTLAARKQIFAAPGGSAGRHFDSYRAVCAKFGRPCREVAPPPAPAIDPTAMLLKQNFGAEVTEDSIAVQGQIERYVIDRKSREIRRVRDNARLLVEVSPHVWPGDPEQLHQLFSVVTMLAMDQLYGRSIKEAPESEPN